MDRKLRELGYSNAQFARVLGRSRTEVQRWINGREQIPRHHLAEIAAYLGSADELEYAMKIKECEDFGDALRRKLREVARISNANPETLVKSVFGLLHEKTADTSMQSGEIGYASALLYNITRANFIYRIWTGVVYSRDFTDLIAPEHIKLHLQYPANHFLGLALQSNEKGSVASSHVHDALAHLRRLASDSPASEVGGLPRHHAIHMLARAGTQADQALVQELVWDATKSPDPLSVRLGYVGLIVRTGNEDVAEKYLWLLQHRQELAVADVMFEALHYGDTELTSNFQLPTSSLSFRRSLASIARRFQNPGSSSAVLELEAFRLQGILDRLGMHYFVDDPLLLQKLLGALQEPGDVRTGPHTKAVTQRLRRIAPPLA
ncbi:helix-turn-helix domain-containing protein [Streptomyces sp. NBC_01465]|uniref:helix-turn-helix domain-containing protein n=1 Tax=Streptomyces sp. NBC_01465 TaxID=2903878 RepID=UPI002E30C962|nr:helix-turn-helix transcriptional regulator [Streptomyces sp. NBC_01465]